MDFVNFYLANRLKKVGFILPESEILGKFDSDGLFHSQLYINFTETMELDETIAPTVSQVLKWLREEKKIHIDIEYRGAFKWRYILIYLHETYFDYFNVIEKGFYSYEEAAFAGINYVLDNLI